MHKAMDVSNVAHKLENMVIVNYKLICWLMWLLGLLVIIVPHVFYERHPFGLILASLFSSIPFAGLAIYTKRIFERKKIESYHKNLKLSSLTGAFILTLLYAIWDFHIYITGFFWILSLGTIFIGYILGGLIYVGIFKIYPKAEIGQVYPKAEMIQPEKAEKYDKT